MATTSVPAGLGRACGAVIRARTVAQGVFDIVVGERGLVLVPLRGQSSSPVAALLLGAFQGGVIGHKRGAANDVRRRENYLAGTADDLARHVFSHRTIRRDDVVRARVWEHNGSGKLRVELNDGAKITLRWKRTANRDVAVAVLIANALGKVVEVRGASGRSVAADKQKARARSAATPGRASGRGRAA
jgi:hypothetical protein